MTRTLLLTLVALLLAGPARAADLVVMTDRALPQSLYDRFTAQTGVAVQLAPGKADALIARAGAAAGAAAAENARPDPAAGDVLLLEHAADLWPGLEAGAYRPMLSEAALGLPAHLRARGDLYLATGQRLRLIVLGPGVGFPEQPGGYEKLASPMYWNSICWTSSRRPENQALAAAMGHVLGMRRGEDRLLTWVKSVNSNMSRLPVGGDEKQLEDLLAGGCRLAFAGQGAVAALAADRPEDAARLQVILPDQDGRGAMPDYAGAALLAGGAHRLEAERFIDFLLSPETQAEIARATGDLPVTQDVALDPALAPYAKARVFALPVEVLGAENAHAREIFSYLYFP